MNTVAVIGVGNLGFRHLESLYKSDMPLSLFAVDPSEAARERARSLAGGSSKGVTAVASIAELPASLDLVIIATGADVRLAMTETLLQRAKVRILVLEKVLFQRPEDFATCERLLAAHGVTCFVNCPRRMYDVYGELKGIIGSSVRYMSVAGGEWGLGCNSVHFVDLFQFMTGRAPTDFALHLDSGSLASKRAGFLEFTGTIHASVDSSALTLTATRGSGAKSHITLVGGDLSCTVDEGSGVARVFEREQLAKEIAFRVPYQSELTSRVAAALLRDGTCALPSYADSAAAHLPFIKAMLAHAQAHVDRGLTKVPIT
jgi:predicted dehydrogenase